MSSFVLIFRDAIRPGPPEDMQRQMEAWGRWFAGLGARVGASEAFLPSGVLVKAGGETQVTPGPGLLGGFAVIEAADLDDAVKAARSCPGLAAGGSVEVRPPADVSGHAGG